MLKEAEKYVFNYKWSVIPVKNKVPQIKWEEYQKRFPTKEELNKWFSDDKKNKNDIGIVTGKLSNLSVVDVDGPTNLNIKSPACVLTKRGRHYYFKYKEGLLNYVKISENVDIRSEGGFVVCAPTSGYR